MRKLVPFLLALLVAACGGGAPENTDWEFLGNSPEMQHHALLAKIDRSNVGRLDLAWWVEMPTPYGLVGNPLVKNGRVFQAGPSGHIFANDLRTGKLLWQFEPEIDLAKASFASYISHQTNRGLALYGDLAIVATSDCRLVAVDQATGKQRWQAQSCNSEEMYGITAAPRVGDGMVFTGNNCMDSGETRGFVDAFDAATGKHRWRFYTVPGDPSKPQDNALYETAAKTWGTDWYGKSHGCGSVWDSITFDPVLHQVYIGVGGPSPVSPGNRAPDAGDELFTNSVVALDAKTGAYKWHFKETPNDAWNFDSIGIMVADLPLAGKQQRVVLSVPKNGFAYVLDAATGKFLSGKNYVDVNWTKGLDANGRPIPEPAAMYWKNGQGQVVEPSTMGSHGWEAMAFDPVANLLYIPAMHIPTYVAPNPGIMGILMDFYASEKPGAKQKAYGELVAWDPVTQSARWRTHAKMPINSGLLHTSGGLVFQGMATGEIKAFDDATGKELWSRQAGGAMRAAPSTVMVDGEQYLIVATGNGAASATGNYVALYNSTPGSRTPPRLLAFRLGGKSGYPPLAKPEPIPAPIVPRQSRELAATGDLLFEGYGCPACHGARGAASGGKAPNLNRRPPPTLELLKQVLQQGVLAANGMPKFTGIPDADVEAIFAYIVNEAWAAHDGVAGEAHAGEGAH